MSKKNQKMKLSNLYKERDEKFPKKAVVIDKYKVMIEKKFRPTKIIKIIEELIEKRNYANENELQFNDIMMQYLYIVKYFTDIDIPEKYEEQISALEVLCDHNIFEQILNEFDQEEVSKINKSYIQSIDNIADLLGMFNNTIKEVNENA